MDDRDKPGHDGEGSKRHVTCLTQGVQSTATVDFVGDNRVIFDLGGNKYRLIVHVSFTFGRLLVKFIGDHAEYDRIDPETVSWRKR